MAGWRCPARCGAILFQFHSSTSAGSEGCPLVHRIDAGRRGHRHGHARRWAPARRPEAFRCASYAHRAPRRTHSVPATRHPARPWVSRARHWRRSAASSWALASPSNTFPHAPSHPCSGALAPAPSPCVAYLQWVASLPADPEDDQAARCANLCCSTRRSGTQPALQRPGAHGVAIFFVGANDKVCSHPLCSSSPALLVR